MRVRFLIPNREDPSKASILYQNAEIDVVPRKGEAVYLGMDEDSATPWIVKWVAYFLTAPTMSKEPIRTINIDVRLIEPDKWSAFE